MEPRWIVVTVVIILAILVDAWLLVRRRRSERLRDQFGPEYRRAVHKFGSVTRAESELEARRKRVQRLEIAPLRPEQAQRFAAAWRTTQARFVDDPDHTIAEADRLVQELMRVRGYPVVASSSESLISQSTIRMSSSITALPTTLPKPPSRAGRIPKISGRPWCITGLSSRIYWRFARSCLARICLARMRFRNAWREDDDERATAGETRCG
jgi:hypothetical protein